MSESMEQEIKCPVCGKTGIPDYHKENTVCPCCGTDLGIYRMIDQIPAESNQEAQKAGAQRNLWKPAAAAAFAAAAVLGILLAWKPPMAPSSTVPDENPLKGRVAELEGQLARLNTQKADEVSRLSESVTALQGRLSEAERQKDEETDRLRNSIEDLKGQLSAAKEQNAAAAYFSYTVRKGDSLWRISSRFYGTGTKAGDIARDNGRTMDSVLHVGDTLRIR